MEGNRDEAIRAKEMAEQKLLEMDYTTAIRFVLKAQTLFPELDGIIHLKDVIELNFAYENKINGQPNLYGVLGVEPSADDDEIKRQFRKKALTLHPDKNRAVGAGDAFKLLNEAWSILSNKDQKAEYDRKITPTDPNQNIPHVVPPTEPSTAAYTGPSFWHNPGPNFWHNPGPNFWHNPGPSYENVHMPRPSQTKKRARTSTSRANWGTFWTKCTNCKYLLKYKDFFVDKLVCCNLCRRTFTAKECPAPKKSFLNPGPQPPQQPPPSAGSATPGVRLFGVNIGVGQSRAGPSG